MKDALIIIDAQNDFIGGSLGTKEARSILPLLAKKLAFIQKDDSTDLFITMDTHSKDYLKTQEGIKLPVTHCLKNSYGWQIADILKPFLPFVKVIIEKNSFGAIELPPYLVDYKKIELNGFCTDICIIANAFLLKSFYPEKEIIIDASCCAGTTIENHQKALEIMSTCQFTIKNKDH